MRQKVLEPIYAEYIPVELEVGNLYISFQYSTASHLCACGCGGRVVTPLGKADWILKFDGAVTLSPSIGNGQWPCRSHYWIRDDKVVWARTMSPAQVNDHRRRDAVGREASYGRPATKWRVISFLRQWFRG